MNKKFFVFCSVVFGLAGIGIWLIISYHSRDINGFCFGWNFP
jgi:hypothetical protein